MMNSIFSNWSLIRVIRLTLGIFIIIQSIEIQNYWLLLPGLIFAIMTLFNLGCGTNGCSVPIKKQEK